MIEKWDYAYNVLIIGDENKKYTNYLKGLFDKVSPHYPYGLEVTNEKVTSVLLNRGGGLNLLHQDKNMVRK